MSDHKAVVEAYLAGFRSTDDPAVLANLAHDIFWAIHGHRTLGGKAAFDTEIEAGGAVDSPTIAVDRLIEDGDTVVAVGHSEMTMPDRGPIGFVFNEVFTFTDDLIGRLETFHINLAR